MVSDLFGFSGDSSFLSTLFGSVTPVARKKETKQKRVLRKQRDSQGRKIWIVSKNLALKRMRTLMTQTGIARWRRKGRTISMLMMRKLTINLPATSGKIQRDLK